MIAALALALAPIAFVPLDDRPVTAQLPVMLGAIAGRPVVEPPAALLGNYLRAGEPDRIIAWLNGPQAAAASAFVVSGDMLAYGGLITSRVPGVTYDDAYFRLRELAHLRAEHPQAWIGAFDTVMRLAPTGVPNLPETAGFFAAYPVWPPLQAYANLPEPIPPRDQTYAADLRAQIGAPALQAYLQTRARDLAVDRLMLQKAADGTVNDLVIGQDDAGPVGLHVAEVAQLRTIVAADALAQRVAIEPGADELGMAMVAHALARGAGWTPRISVRYSMPDGAQTRDPLEYAPVSTAIDALVRLCGGTLVERDPEIVLYVRVRGTDAVHDRALLGEMAASERAGLSVAFADETFLEDRFDRQAAFAQELLRSGIASRLDAYSSWNTNANTVGTALAEAVAAGAGRRMGTYDALAQKTFTFNRIVDDYAFHDYVRIELNKMLDAQGVEDHTYLVPSLAERTAALNRAWLWARAQAILPELYPGYHIASMAIALPWNRTFETRIDAALAPTL